MSNEPQTDMEMPKYKCHKEVWALKIAEIEVVHIESGAHKEITPADDSYVPFIIDWAYFNKHNPQPGGYYMVYEDGYKSYSPAEAFESGYTVITL